MHITYVEHIPAAIIAVMMPAFVGVALTANSHHIISLTPSKVSIAFSPFP